MCFATEATATVWWQKARGGGGGGNTTSSPRADDAASHTQTPKPTEATVELAIGSAPAEPVTTSSPAELANGSAGDRPWDAQALWESPSSGELQGTPGAPLGVLGGPPCDNAGAARER